MTGSTSQPSRPVSSAGCDFLLKSTTNGGPRGGQRTGRRVVLKPTVLVLVPEDDKARPRSTQFFLFLQPFPSFKLGTPLMQGNRKKGRDGSKR